MIDAFLHAAILMTTPILLAAIGGLVNRIGGLVNLGLELMMLAGALVAVEVSAATGSAAAGGARRRSRSARSVGLADVAVVTRPAANEIIVGLGFARRGRGPRALSPEERLRRLRHLQSAGRRDAAAARHPRPRRHSGPRRPRFATQDPLTWLAWALVPADRLRARAGRAGACGCARPARRRRRCAPSASRRSPSATPRPYSRARLSGLAGAHLSIGVVGLFNEGITGGRGFIALAAFYFGRTSPVAHGARRAAVRRVRRGADPPARTGRAGRDRPDPALRHRHPRPDRPRASPTGVEARRSMS